MLTWKTILQDARLLALLVLTVVGSAWVFQTPQAFHLDLGSRVDQLLLEGFFPAEGDPAAPYRWTTSPASIRLPNLASGDQAARARLVISAPRGEDVDEPTPVTVSVNGQSLATWQTPPNPSEFVLEIPGRVTGPDGNLNLTLEAPLFTVPSDLRPLALIVHDVRVEPVGGGVQTPPLRTLLIVTATVLLVYAWLRRLGVWGWIAFLAAAFVLASLLAGLISWRPFLTPLASRLLFTLLVGLLGTELALRGTEKRGDLRTYRRASALLLGAIAVRLVVAHSPGDHDNFLAFKMMLENVTRNGIAAAYDIDPIIGAYPPVHHIMLKVAGEAYRLLVSPGLDIASMRLNFMMKMPTIVLDTLIVVVILHYALTMRAARTSLGVAALYAFNPGIIYVVAYHGQLGDPLYTLFVVAAVAAILAGRGVVAGASAALGVLTKPQAFAFFPYLFVAGLRHLTSRQIPRALAAGLITTLLVLSPFLLAGTFGSLIRTVSMTVGHGPRIASLAQNIWWLWGWGRAWTILDTETFFGPITYRHAGLFLYFVLAQGLIIWKTWGVQSRSDLALLAAYAGMAFFMLPTEIHENYLFPTFALLALAAVHDRRAWPLSIVLGLTWLINLLSYDPTLLGPLAPPDYVTLSPLFPLQVLAAVVNVSVFLLWTWWVMRMGVPVASPVARTKSAVQ